MPGRHQGARQDADDPGPLDRRRFGRDQLHRAVALVDHRLALTDEPPEEAEAGMDEPSTDRVLALVDLGQRKLDQLHRTFAPTGEVGEIGRFPERIDVIHVDPLGRIRDASPQGQHPFRLTMRIHVGMEGHGRSRGLVRRRERLRGIAGSGPVERQLRGRSGNATCRRPIGVDEPPGDRSMETLTLAREQPGEDHLGEQGVAEPVRRSALVDLEDVATHALAHPFLHLVRTGA